MSILGCLRAEALRYLPMPPRVWVQFVIWATLHTSSLLFMEKGALDPGSLPLRRRLGIIVRTWSNIRRLPLREETGNFRYSKFDFILKRSAQVLFLLMAQRVISSLSINAFKSLSINLSDFAPSKQGILPPFNGKDLSLRAVLSLQWIWDTYIILNACHHLFAMVFVAALRWDLPEDWPPLFGSVAEAYSLRRFWGVFWQRLHVVPFEHFMPRFLVQDQRGKLSGTCRSSLRALWVFTISALCHIAVNWVVLHQGGTVPELRFFLSNFFICLVEKLTTSWLPCISRSSTLRFLGYFWVMVIFFCLVPSWRYPLILAELLQ
ncbi:hypothetical protein F4802DRAFT_593127 [Xylaria palmicola]|nr:hypothetical protein F4802DRAFT_593127 [Xylaria palmicola]